MQLWREYFGPDAVVAGIDINPSAAAVGDPGLIVRIGSQDDPALLRKVVAETGGVDIVLDDGGHVAEHQRTSFDVLFPLLTGGGVYAVEDLHTSYWHDFGGSYGRGKSFIEVTKQLIDDMHAWWHDQGDVVGVDAARRIPKITMYDSLVFIAKLARERPAVVQFGAMLDSPL